jgi:hypothetical protein
MFSEYDGVGESFRKYDLEICLDGNHYTVLVGE